MISIDSFFDELEKIAYERPSKEELEDRARRLHTGAVLGAAAGLISPFAHMAIRRELGVPAWERSVPVGALLGAAAGLAYDRLKKKDK